jgi:hypothetical protein
MYDPCDEGFRILEIFGGLQHDEKAKLYDLFFVSVSVVL